MKTAIIGNGNIGSRVANHLTDGGETITVVGKHDDIGKAIRDNDAIIFAVWYSVMQDLIDRFRTDLVGKVVIDPSNPITADGKGGFVRTLPDGQSAGQVIASGLPEGAHYAKAFGSMSADSLGKEARRNPPVVLFYASDDATASRATKHLIEAAGFEPVHIGGVDQAIREEVFGDLHQYGGLRGRVVTLPEAQELVHAHA